MGFKTDLPTTCIVVNGQRKCGLIERNNLEGEQRLYVQDKIFSAIYYTKIPSKIYKIQKSVDSITFNRRGVQWHSKTIVVHPHIKKIVLSHTFKKLKKLEIMRSAIQDKINFLKSVHATYDEEKIATEVVTLCYRDLYLQSLKNYINSPRILKLRESNYKDSVSNESSTDCSETHEIMRIPPELENCSLEELQNTLKNNADYSY